MADWSFNWGASPLEGWSIGTIPQSGGGGTVDWQENAGLEIPGSEATMNWGGNAVNSLFGLISGLLPGALSTGLETLGGMFGFGGGKDEAPLLASAVSESGKGVDGLKTTAQAYMNQTKSFLQQYNYYQSMGRAYIGYTPAWQYAETAKSNYETAKSNYENYRSQYEQAEQQQQAFQQALELYNRPESVMARQRGMSDDSGLTNSIANAGAGALTNAFGNLLRGGAPTESGGTGTPLEGFRMQEIPGIDAPEWGSGSNQFAQGKGPSTKSGNYGDVTNLLGQLFNQSGRKWDLPDRDQQEDPNLNYQMFDMPNPTFGYEGGMSAAPGQASASGMTGLSTMPMNPGVGQGGISLGGQGFAGGFGDKQSSMNGMFPQQPGFSGSMKF